MSICEGTKNVLNLNTCLNNGKEKQVDNILGLRKEVENYSKEKLFVLTLCFSGKIKWPNILEIYSEIIDTYNLNEEEIEGYVRQFNE